jgi:hypothetical protein
MIETDGNRVVRVAVEVGETALLFWRVGVVMMSP